MGVIRGFVTGVIWGGVVASAGLAVISQVAPLPDRTVATDSAPDAEPTAEVIAPEAIDPTPAETPEPAAEVAVIDPPEILQKVPDAEPPQAAEAPEEAQISTDEPAPAGEAPVAETVLPSDLPEENLDVPVMSAASPPATVEDEAPVAPLAPALAESDAAIPTAPVEEEPVATALPPPVVPGAESQPAPVDAPPPAPEAASDEPLLQPQPLEAADPAPALITPILPEAEGETMAEPAPGLMPDTGLDSDVAGVTTNRLPRIGDSAPDAIADPEAEAESADVEIAEGLPVLGTTPLELFRRAFDNPDGKPLFAILLIDDGSADLDRANLAALPFPVSFVVDPLAANSTEASGIYRAAGQEVLMLASGIPDGATASDLEQTFQALDMALPEAVAVIDRSEGGFQEDLDRAGLVLPIIAEQGRGIVTFDQGLNPADQIARREGVPSATIFRVLDATGESIPKMRNYLDRAAFKAAQEGRVLVIGSAKPETVAAILEWTVEGRASSVALAPVSAVLQGE
jgi:hypothetical protein